jgi:hypothetical protein
MNNIKFQIEICNGSLNNDPFFVTQSPFPFNVSVGDEIAGDALGQLQNEIGQSLEEGMLKVHAVRQYFFKSDGEMAARNLRIAVEIIK